MFFTLIFFNPSKKKLKKKIINRRNSTCLLIQKNTKMIEGEMCICYKNYKSNINNECWACNTCEDEEERLIINLIKKEKELKEMMKENK